MMIEIKTIPHNQQRYDTVGDWWWDSDGWHIRISDLPDWRYVFLIAFHELLEMAWCSQNDVAQVDVDAFDIEYENSRGPGNLSEPGDAPDAPYHLGHQFATAAERLAAAVLGVDWTQYETAIYALEYTKDA
jgi:hypothetical protein